MKRYISNIWYILTYRFVRPKLIVARASFSGDESFIDIRYWLSRPDRINLKTSPYLLTTSNQKIGLMHFSKYGAIKTKTRKYTNTGIMLFYNKNHTVKKGDSLILCWDGFTVENIEVK